MVPGAIDDEREIPEQQPTFRLWCGLLKSSYEENFSAEFEAVDYPFPVDSMGIPKIPFARALVHIARDHFEFATADDGRPPPLDMEQRLQSVEQLLADMRVSLARLAPPPPGLTGDGGPRAAPLPPPPADVGKRQAAAPSIPPGIDPGVARQALQSGVTPEALVEMAKVLNVGPPGRTPHIPQARLQKANAVLSSEEEEEEEEVAGGGSQKPVEKAVIHLSKIVTRLAAEKKLTKDRTLESLLDRAESGSASWAPAAASQPP